MSAAAVLLKTAVGCSIFGIGVLGVFLVLFKEERRLVCVYFRSGGVINYIRYLRKCLYSILTACP